MNQMIKAALFKTLLTVNTPIIIAENLIAAKCRLMVQHVYQKGLVVCSVGNVVSVPASSD
jgi:hypothetical protein